MGEHRRYYYGVDAARFCAALMVLCYHLCFTSWANAAAASSRDFAKLAHFDALAHYTWFGWIGVEIFFVISGFVIANSAKGKSAVDFLLGRAARLYPAAWICATLTLAVLLLSGSPLSRWLLTAYLHAIVLFPAGPWVDAVYWTLGLEIIFYGLVFALIAAGWFRHLSLLACALAILSGLFFLGLYLQTATSPGLEKLEAIKFLRFSSFFALGIFIWLSTERRLRPWELVLISLSIFLGCAEITLTSKEWARLANIEHWQSLVPVVVWVCFITFIWASAFARSPNVPTIRHVCRNLGSATYPLYLSHAIFGISAMTALIRAGVSPYTALGMALCLALGLAAIISAWAEPVARSWLAKYLDRFQLHLKRLRAVENPRCRPIPASDRR